MKSHDLTITADTASAIRVIVIPCHPLYSWTSPVLDTEGDYEMCGSYFAAKVNEALKELEHPEKLSKFNTVEELFEYLDR